MISPALRNLPLAKYLQMKIYNALKAGNIDLKGWVNEVIPLDIPIKFAYSINFFSGDPIFVTYEEFN